MIDINDLKSYLDKEKDLMDKVNELEEEFNNKLESYWIQECGDDFEKYEKILRYIKSSFDRDNEYSIVSMEIELTNLINRCMKNLVSKRNVTDIKLHSSYYGSEYVSLYQNGFGYINPSWDYKTTKISTLREYIDLFSMDVDWKEYVFKKSKKEMIDSFQKNIPKWIKLSNDDLVKRIDIDEIKIVDKETGYGNYLTNIKILTEHNVIIDLNSYPKKIRISDRILGGCCINLKDQDISARDCYLLSLIWKDSSDEIKDLIRSIAKIRRINKKILSDIKEEVSPHLLSEEL